MVHAATGDTVVVDDDDSHRPALQRGGRLVGGETFIGSASDASSAPEPAGRGVGSSLASSDPQPSGSRGSGEAAAEAAGVEHADMEGEESDDSQSSTRTGSTRSEHSDQVSPDERG